MLINKTFKDVKPRTTKVFNQYNLKKEKRKIANLEDYNLLNAENIL
jgi:hypothetical protein